MELGSNLQTDDCKTGKKKSAAPHRVPALSDLKENYRGTLEP